MNTDPDKSSNQTSANSWLDNLQRESWQLELLISGFSIFLLIGGWGWVKDAEHTMVLLKQGAESFYALEGAYHVMRTAYSTLLACLLIHVIMRGIWIAAIGLRSVSGDIDYDQLPYQPKFKDHLFRRIGSFDDYLERLERYCSVLFSLAFLIIFCFLSIAAYMVATILIKEGLVWLFGADIYSNPIVGHNGLLDLLLIVIGLVYMFDFVTLGLLKRSKWLGKPYYYIYRWMGWVTLARFYRPLYYNLIDNRFGRKLAIALPVTILAIIVIVSLKQVNSTYLPGTLGDGTMWVYDNNYDDEVSSRIYQSWRMSLSSRYAPDDYVEAFVPYIPTNDDETLRLIDPDMEVANYTGIKLEGAFNIGRQYNPDADFDQLMGAFQQLYKIYLNDSLLTTVTPRFYRHKERRQVGVLYLVPVHDLPVGEHTLRSDKRMMLKDTARYNRGQTIYFYK